jgi:peptidoglycan-N-acetylglucosamine deacetylase
MINEVLTSQKLAAITFDDGPNPIYTPELLKIFSKVKGKATFFMIGEQMRNYPEVVKQVAAEGHEIGNHTFTHPKLSQLNDKERLAEIEQTENVIEELTGQKPTLFRPPYLDYNQDTVLLLKEKGYPMVGALNLEAQDWEQPGIDHIFNKSREVVKNGSILIFHDGYGDRSQTIEAVRRLVAELTSEGYQLVTVSQLLKSR